MDTKGVLTDTQKLKIAEACVGAEMTDKDHSVPASLAGDEVLSTYYKEADRVITLILWGYPADQALMASDIFGGMTNNKIVGNGGHSEEYYWYNANGTWTGKQVMEGFAEHYSSVLTGNQEAIDANINTFPRAVPLLAEYVEWTCKYHYEQLRLRYMSPADRPFDWEDHFQDVFGEAAGL